MNKHSDDFYCAAIKNIYQNSWSIRKPLVQGGVCPLFLVDTPDGTKVCRFGEKEMVARNKLVSDLLTFHDIPVPYTRTHAFLDMYFESYDYCADKTLYEHILSGMPSKVVDNVYNQVFDIQRRISQIPSSDFMPDAGRTWTDVFSICKKMVIPASLVEVYSVMFRLFADSGKLQLLHNDVNPKNLLVDDKGNLTKLIDLDCITMCNESFSVFLMIKRAKPEKRIQILKNYEKIVGRSVNNKAILTAARAFDAMKYPIDVMHSAFWRGYQGKQHY